MHLRDLNERLAALGAKPAHAARVLRLWSHALPQEGGARRPEDFLPRALREGLPALMAELASSLSGDARVRSRRAERSAHRRGRPGTRW